MSAEPACIERAGPGIAEHPARALGYSAAVASGILYGVASLLNRGLLDRGFPPLGGAVLRSLLAAALLAAVLGAASRSAFRLGRRDLVPLLLYSLVTGAVMPYCLFAALDRAPVGVVIALSYTAPPLAALLAWAFLREPISRLALVSLGVAIVGAVLVSGVLGRGAGAGVSGVGIGLGLVLGLCAAIFAVGARRLLRTFSASTITLYGVGLGGLVLLAADGLSARSLGDVPRLTWVSGLLLLGSALVPMILARYLFTWSMHTIGPAQASLLGSLELAAATLGALAVLDEVPTALEAAGIGTILVGAILVRLDVLRAAPAPVGALRSKFGVAR